MPQLANAQGPHCTHVITRIKVVMPGRGTPSRRASLISRHFQNLALAGFLVGSWSGSFAVDFLHLGLISKMRGIDTPVLHSHQRVTCENGG